MFVSFDGFEPVTLYNLGLQKAMKSSFLWRGLLFACLLGVLSLELVKFFPWGRVSAPAGVAPEALEEWLIAPEARSRAVSIVVWLIGQ